MGTDQAGRVSTQYIVAAVSQANHRQRTGRTQGDVDKTPYNGDL